MKRQALTLTLVQQSANTYLSKKFTAPLSPSQIHSMGTVLWNGQQHPIALSDNHLAQCWLTAVAVLPCWDELTKYASIKLGCLRVHTRLSIWCARVTLAIVPFPSKRQLSARPAGCRMAYWSCHLKQRKPLVVRLNWRNDRFRIRPNPCGTVLVKVFDGFHSISK